jgi:hypothetical protein
MKKLILLSTILILSQKILYAQLNSIELKDGTGTSLGFYSTIAGAYAGIPQPLIQAYLIEMQSTYDASQETFPIALNEKSGTSSVNTITIRPASTVISITISSSQGGLPILLLDGADHVILDGRAGGSGSQVLIIENSAGDSNTNTIQLENGAENNIIRYCDIRNGTTALSGRGVAILGTNTGTGNTNNRIEFCKLTSGRYKINSNPGLSAVPNNGTVIYGCEFLDISFVAIWCQSASGKMYIDSNTIHSLSPVGNGPYGMLFDAQSDTIFINGNKIYDLDNGSSNTSDVIAISVRSTSAANPGTTYITNNFIALNSTNVSSFQVAGIQYDGSNPVTSHVYFNTVRITGVAGSSATNGSVASACFIKEATDDSASAYDIRDNIFVNERTGGISGAQHVALAILDTAAVSSIDYNIYSGTSAPVRWRNTLYNDMNLYRSARFPLEQNSNDTVVEFVSVTDLHLTNSSPGNEGLSGISISGYSDDIDGDFRGSVPYRGADEASILLSTGKSIKENAFVIYPNPANDRIVVHFEDATEGDVEFYSVTSMLVKRQKVNNRICTIDVSSLETGLYFVRMSRNEKLQKLMVVR